MRDERTRRLQHNDFETLFSKGQDAVQAATWGLKHLNLEQFKFAVSYVERGFSEEDSSDDDEYVYP